MKMDIIGGTLQAEYEMDKSYKFSKYRAIIYLIAFFYLIVYLLIFVRIFNQ
jgi:hypothetical protein